MGQAIAPLLAVVRTIYYMQFFYLITNYITIAVARCHTWSLFAPCEKNHILSFIFV